MFAKTLCKVRGIAFWSLDWIKGSDIRKAYKNVKKYDCMDSCSDELISYQKEALKRLISHAKATTKYYGSIESFDIFKHPVINKNIMREKQEDFLSDRYDKNKLITMSTSGSTGTPFVCYQNRGKKKRVNAEVIYFSEKARYKLGENLIYLRVLIEKNKKPKLKQWIQNETLIDISHLNDEHIRKVLFDIEKISSYNGSVILAYASTYDALKDYTRRKGTSEIGKSKIRSVISSSEMLFEQTRSAMSESFNCRCFSRYSNQENGVLGQDDPDNPGTFILNEPHYFFEILKIETDEPAEEGEVGRIVVTDLYNYAMPMIRYDTGDIGAFTYVTKDGVSKKAITNFGGRKVDAVFDINGNRLSPHFVTNTFWSFPQIRQFQFIQQGRNEYIVKINAGSEFAGEKDVEKALKELLGSNAIISIERVEEIPVMSSGKRRYIINKVDWREQSH